MKEYIARLSSEERDKLSAMVSTRKTQAYRVETCQRFAGLRFGAAKLVG